MTSRPRLDRTPGWLVVLLLASSACSALLALEETPPENTAAIDGGADVAAAADDAGGSSGGDAAAEADVAPLVDAMARDVRNDFADTGPPKRVFVTATVVAGSMGGIAGADERCRTAGSKLGGDWQAWISTTGDHAIDRISAAGPWYSLDRTTMIFSGKTGPGSLSTTPLAPIDRTDQGTPLTSSAAYWTGTKVGGQASGNDCAGWNALAEGVATEGSAAVTDTTWTNARSSGTCTKSNRLLCLEK